MFEEIHKAAKQQGILMNEEQSKQVARNIMKSKVDILESSIDESVKEVFKRVLSIVSSTS